MGCTNYIFRVFINLKSLCHSVILVYYKKSVYGNSVFVIWLLHLCPCHTGMNIRVFFSLFINLKSFPLIPFFSFSFSPFPSNSPLPLSFSPFPFLLWSLSSFFSFSLSLLSVLNLILKVELQSPSIFLVTGVLSLRHGVSALGLLSSNGTVGHSSLN